MTVDNVSKAHYSVINNNIYHNIITLMDLKAVSCDITRTDLKIAHSKR